MDHVVLIEPHNSAPEAVNATENTFRMLPGGGSFERDDAGELVWEDGKLRLKCSNPGFVCFAAVQQGYAKSAVRK